MIGSQPNPLSLAAPRLKTTTALLIAIACLLAGLGFQRVDSPKYTITLQQGKLDNWMLVAANGVPCFVSGPRERRPGDHEVGPYDSKCKFLQRLDNEVTGVLKFLPREKFAGGLMVADYSTVPPMVHINPMGGKYDKWIIHAGEGKVRHIEHVNELGKTAWLTMDDQGSVVPVGREGNQVVELRRAVLSFEKKAAFSVSKVELSK